MVNDRSFYICMVKSFYIYNTVKFAISSPFLLAESPFKSLTSKDPIPWFLAGAQREAAPAEELVGGSTRGVICAEKLSEMLSQLC